MSESSTESNSSKRPCVFFDRDGIINESVAYYILSPDDFHVFPAFIEALQIATERGYAAVVITNQKCVGLGQISESGLGEIHDKLRRIVAEAGLELLDIYFCGDTEPTPRKKPAPGMLLEAAEAHGLELRRSWMIGDSPRDVEAGRAAGCQTLLVNEDKTSPAADQRIDAVTELPGFLRKNLKPLMNEAKIFRPKGVIFDWDGVVVDSSAQHKLAWEKMAVEHRLPLPDNHFQLSFGKRNEEIIPGILGWAETPEDVAKLAFIKEETYRGLIRETGIEPLPGIPELFAWLRAEGIPFAVGSSTPRDNLIAAIELLNLPDDFFVAILSGDDVDEGKPAPEVFLKAAAALGVEPAEALVFEDSFSGIQAAKNGGIPVIAVATTNHLDELGAADAAVFRLSALGFGKGDGMLTVRCECREEYGR